MKKLLGKSGAARIGFPAVLGLKQTVEVVRDLEEKLGLAVFEIPTLPPSIPGMRLHNLLVAEIERQGGRVLEGMEAVSAECDGDVVLGVWSDAAARPKLNRAGSYILATGGILGGGVQTGYDGRISECVFDLPLAGYSEAAGSLTRSFLGSGGHPVFRAGVKVNRDLQPLSSNGERIYRNLYAAGAALANTDPIQERSVEGVALVSGFAAGRQRCRAMTDEHSLRLPLHPVELSLDQCIKCNICTTACPVSAVTDLFPGPKYEAPQGGRFRSSKQNTPDRSVDYCSGCRVCNMVCPTGVNIAEMNARARAAMVDQNLVPVRLRLRNNLIARTGAGRARSDSR